MGLSFATIDLGQIFAGLGSTVKDIRTAITGINPDKAAEINLKLIELEGKLVEAQAQSEKALADDRASARLLGAEYVKAGKTNWNQNILGALAVILLCGIVWAIFGIGVTDSTKDIVNILLGGVIKIVYDIYAYYFGGSFGSAQKNIMLENVLSKVNYIKKDE